MEKIIEQIKKMNDSQKVVIFEFLVDDLKLKTKTLMAEKYFKSYGGVLGLAKEYLKTKVCNTTYFIDK